MKTKKYRILLLSLLLMNASLTGKAQDISFYQAPAKLSIPSFSLKDTETVELILPRDLATNEDVKYPVLFVFDKQNRSIYKNTLQTIDYLTAMMQMPPCIIVGITYNNSNRNRRTMPDFINKSGQAEQTLSFLLDELYPVLVKDYRAAAFTLFIGHSRTAIFSGHALSKRPRDINGIIASSISYFDFGQKEEKASFDRSIDTIAQLKRKSFYFFSAGDSLAGDGHESSVRQLDQYLRAKQLPSNFIWQSYLLKGASHNTTPGLTVPQALNTIFDRYMETLSRLFKKPFTADTSLLFSYINKEYEEVSAYYGYTIQPDIVLYNSLASHYKYNANELGEKRFIMVKALYEKGIVHYPYFEGFYYDLASLYEQQNNIDLYREYLIKALACVDKNMYIDQAEARNNIIQKLLQIKNK